MTRKEFIEQVGGGVAAVFLTACAASCKKTSTVANAPQGPANVNFTVDVSVAPLNANGGYLVQNGVIVARTTTGAFVAIAATCTHAGGTLYFSNNAFACPVHGATFDTNGNITGGPATAPEKKYNTSLSGTTLRVYS